MGEPTCDKYIWEDINIFFQSYFVPCSKHTCVTNVVNHVLFALVILIILGFLFSYATKSSPPFIICLFFATIHAVYWYYAYSVENKTSKTLKEKFSVPNFPDIPNVPASPDEILEETIGSSATYPTAKNPFMNVLVDEIKYNPTRSPAAPMTDLSVNMSLEDFFHTQFVNDPTDVFGRSQSQRQFYTTPSTSVPNDQGSYQDWLYKIPGKTCKEGGREACMPGTDGGALPWINVNP